MTKGKMIAKCIFAVLLSLASWVAFTLNMIFNTPEARLGLGAILFIFASYITYKTISLIKEATLW